MAKIITVGDKLRLTVDGVTDAGQRGKLVGVPTWRVDRASLSLLPAVDGLTCVATALAGGDCTVTATLGLLSEVYAVSILPSAAIKLVISAEEIKS